MPHLREIMLATTRIALAVLIAGGLCVVEGFQPDTYGVVIAGGRVIDPASGLDEVRHVGISDGVIRAISAQRLNGRTTLDASGLVVAPGFIDLHQHAQRAINPAVDKLKVMDGVTTALELEVGTDDIDRWYDAREGKSLLNYGVSIGHIPTRMAVMKDPGDFLPSGPAAPRAAGAGGIPHLPGRAERGPGPAAGPARPRVPA